MVEAEAEAPREAPREQVAPRGLRRLIPKERAPGRSAVHPALEARANSLMAPARTTSWATTAPYQVLPSTDRRGMSQQLQKCRGRT